MTGKCLVKTSVLYSPQLVNLSVNWISIKIVTASNIRVSPVAGSNIKVSCEKENFFKNEKLLILSLKAHFHKVFLQFISKQDSGVSPPCALWLSGAEQCSAARKT